jgi:APA family basic amino acid/polyamine antiporter
MTDKKIGLLTACALVIANMVGTGVFSSLGFQVASLPSVPILLFLWLCGGIIALCGGFSYVELSKIYPNSGGEYHYISSAYPKWIGYFAGITSVVAGFSAPVALAAITFSRYFAQFSPQISQKWLAFVLISVITFFHCFSLRLGSGFQLVTTTVKVALVMLFIIFGLFTPTFANPIELQLTDISLIGSKGFAISLVYVSFAYSGWNACVYIFSEIKNPEKNIPLSILIGTSTVTVLYMLLNFVFLKTVPIGKLDGVIEIGAVSANVIFDTSGGKIMAILIGLLIVSSISAMVWVGPRVIARMMNWKNVNKHGKETPRVPLRAMVLQYLVTTTLLITETFEQILVSAGVLMCICSSLSVAILFFGTKRISINKLLAPFIFLIANIYTLIVLLT